MRKIFAIGAAGLAGMAGAAAAAETLICTQHRVAVSRTYETRLFRGEEQWEYHCPWGHKFWYAAQRRPLNERVGGRIDDRLDGRIR